MEDMSKRTETVRPQVDERCERQRECDSVLSATNDENDVELNGETDDEDMEDGEMGFDDGSVQVRNIRDPGQPTVKEHQEHVTTHRPYRSWCKFCVMGRGVRAPHSRSDARDDLEGVPHVSMDYGFLGESESEEQVSPVLVIRERRHKMTWAMLVREACRRRIEDLLKGDPVGSARLAAADERINRALADAVERHATKDPGVRGILKRASVVCHPESESQKKIAMDSEQDPIPHPSVSHGGSSASGT